MKFLNRQKFLDTVNQWVRDGSNIVSLDANPVGEIAVLHGRDGVTEILAFFYDKVDYDQSELPSAEEDHAKVLSDSPVKEDPIIGDGNKTPAEILVDSTLENVRLTRVELINRLMKDPGSLAVFGDNFDVKFGDVMTFIDDDRLDPLMKLRIRVEHDIVVTGSRDGSRAITNQAEADTRFVDRRVQTIMKLRQDLEGARLEDDQMAVIRISKELDQMDQDLSEKNLRLTKEGNLESV